MAVLLVRAWTQFIFIFKIFKILKAKIWQIRYSRFIRQVKIRCANTIGKLVKEKLGGIVVGKSFKIFFSAKL